MSIYVGLLVNNKLLVGSSWEIQIPFWCFFYKEKDLVVFSLGSNI